jgi:hypothetical protein
VDKLPHSHHYRLLELPTDPSEVYPAELSTEPIEVCRLELPDHLSQGSLPELHTPHSEDWILELSTDCSRNDPQVRELPDQRSMAPLSSDSEDVYMLRSELLTNLNSQHIPVGLTANTGRDVTFQSYSDSENSSLIRSIHQEDDLVAGRTPLGRLQTGQRWYTSPNSNNPDISHIPSPMQVSPVTPNLEITRYATIQQSDVSPIDGTMSPHQPVLQCARHSPNESYGGYYPSNGSFFSQPESSAGSSTAESSRYPRGTLMNHSGNIQSYSNSPSNSDSLNAEFPYYQQLANEPFMSRRSTAVFEAPWDGADVHTMGFDHHERRPSWYRTPSHVLAMFENGVANRPPDFRDNVELFHEYNGASDSPQQQQQQHDPHPLNEHILDHSQPLGDFVLAVQYPKKKCKFCDVAEFTGK